MAVLAMAIVAAVAVAPAAHAGEFKSFDQRYVNGKCQDSVIDQDCYHQVSGTYQTRQACFNKMGAILGVNPKTKEGSYFINTYGEWYCPARPPVGYHYMYVYVSECAVGLPFSKCP